VLCIALSLLAASFSGRPAVCADEAPPVVASIEFTGRSNLQEEPLRDALSLKLGDPFQATRMEQDRKALLALGFFRSVAAAQRTVNGRTMITYRLAELPRVFHIRVTGNTIVELRTLQELISTQLGQVLCLPQLQDDVRGIERLYRERGYVARLAEKPLEEATRSGILVFNILEVRIEEVVMEGASARLRERARKLLAEAPPALYRPEAVSDDQRRLLKLRGIRTAVPRVETTTPGKVRIRWLLNTPTPTEPAGS
jgi:outer membrane protein assembly factor BamA